MHRKFAALFAALSLTLLAIVPTLGATGVTGIPAGGFSSDNVTEGTTDECKFSVNGQPVVIPEDSVLWHFVLNQSANATQTLSGEFDTYGPFGPIAPYKAVGSFTLHYYIITDDPDTLLSASTSGGADGSHLQLSHVCHHTPPPVVPEAPFAVLLVITGGLTAAWFVSRKMRSSVAPTAA